MTDPRLIERDGPRREMKDLSAALDAIERDSERFWKKPSWSGECLEFPGRTSKEGYVRHTVQLGGSTQKTVSAHKIAYFLSTGRWPSANLCVCHTCDNPRCVNPKHLWLGTPKDNSQDMVKKGRWHGRLSLSDDDARQIRALCDAGIPHLRIQKLTGVNRHTVRKIAKGISYQWVEAG